MIRCGMPYQIRDGSIVFPLTPTSGVEAVRVRLETRLRTIQGEWPSDVSVGLPWIQWIEAGYVEQAEADALVRAQIEADPAVVSVDVVTVVKTGEDLSVAVRCTISVEGTTSVLLMTVGPDPWDTRSAPPWYLSSGALRYTRGAVWGG